MLSIFTILIHIRNCMLMLALCLLAYPNQSMSKSLQFEQLPLAQPGYEKPSFLIITTKNENCFAGYGCSEHLELGKSNVNKVFVQVTKKDRDKIIYFWLIRKAYSEVSEYSRFSAQTKNKMRKQLQKSLSILVTHFSKRDKSVKNQFLPIGSIVEIRGPEFLSFGSIYWQKVFQEWDALEVILLLEKAAQQPLTLIKGKYPALEEWPHATESLLRPVTNNIITRINQKRRFAKEALILRGTYLVQQLSQSSLLLPISLRSSTTGLKVRHPKLVKKLFKKPAKLLKQSL